MPFFGTVEFRQEECCNCHMLFMMTMDYYKAKKADGSSFHCPAGHVQFYVKSDVQKLQEKLERSEREAASLRESKVAAERARDKAKNAIKRLKKRNAAGICLCCNRSVKQLAEHMKTEHMKTKHPQFRALQGLEAPKQLPAKSEAS